MQNPCISLTGWATKFFLLLWHRLWHFSDNFFPSHPLSISFSSLYSFLYCFIQQFMQDFHNLKATLVLGRKFWLGRNQEFYHNRERCWKELNSSSGFPEPALLPFWQTTLEQSSHLPFCRDKRQGRGICCFPHTCTHFLLRRKQNRSGQLV